MSPMPRQAGDAEAVRWGFHAAAEWHTRPFTGRQHLATMHRIVLPAKGRIQPARGAVQQADPHLLLKVANPRLTLDFGGSAFCAAAVKLPISATGAKQRHILQLFKHDCSPHTNTPFLIVHLIMR